MSKSEALGGKEKLFIALAAAMGGGCRTCAQGLHGMAGSAGVSPEEVGRAFAAGLDVRESATRVMRSHAERLVGRGLCECSTLEPATDARVLELSRVAAAIAANSSPDALRHIQAAKSAGATDAEIEVAIGTARMVRTKAQGFSDAEAGVSRSEETPAEASPCSGTAEKKSDTPEGGACC
jgi:alkylhydroperoxidase/carboxymuconolactone decarboxylase family protein YurZ